MTDSSKFDPKEFRRALGSFATGVTVITAQDQNGEKVGVTANSFNSVSLDPPLILWSIAKRSGSYPVFKRATHFTVNILAADQIDLSNHFARPQDDKFANISYTVAENDALVLPDCSAHFVCENHKIIDGGDHWILIGKVVSFADIGHTPLLYHQGGYAQTVPHMRRATDNKKQIGSNKETGVLESNLYYLMTQALQRYQEIYQPLQRATGLRVTEARMLMVLSQAPYNQEDLLCEVNMPLVEIKSAAGHLQQIGLIQQSDDGYEITEMGKEQAKELWEISSDVQAKTFKPFTSQDIEGFQNILKKLMLTT